MGLKGIFTYCTFPNITANFGNRRLIAMTNHSDMTGFYEIISIDSNCYLQIVWSSRYFRPQSGNIRIVTNRVIRSTSDTYFPSHFGKRWWWLLSVAHTRNYSRLYNSQTVRKWNPPNNYNDAVVIWNLNFFLILINKWKVHQNFISSLSLRWKFN